MSLTFTQRVERVNAQLQAGEPDNISRDDKGRDGYLPQAIIDAVNAEFGVDWRFSCTDLTRQPDVGKTCRYTANVTVWVTHDGVESSRSAYGEGTQPLNNLGDCMKSAQTEALKKALSQFSFGSRAYWGLLSAKSDSSSDKGASAQIAALNERLKRAAEIYHQMDAELKKLRQPYRLEAHEIADMLKYATSRCDKAGVDDAIATLFNGNDEVWTLTARQALFDALNLNPITEATK